MAREMALAGVDRSELTPPPPPEKPKHFLDKLSNFWYHYKPFVIGGAFLLIVAVWLLVKTLTNNPVDYTLVMVTEEPLSAEQLEAVEKYVVYCGTDIDGDGFVEVDIENLVPYYYTDVAPAVGRTDNDRLQSYLVTGEVMLYAFEPSVYDRFCETIAQTSQSSDDYVFFGGLTTADEHYDAQRGGWNWNSDERIAEFGINGAPENMIFGVRRVDGTAAKESSAEMAEQGRRLIANMIESARYDNAAADIQKEGMS